MVPSHRMGTLLGALLASGIALDGSQQIKQQPVTEPRDDPKPPGHNGNRAMARRVRQMERAAAKSLSKPKVEA